MGPEGAEIAITRRHETAGISVEEVLALYTQMVLVRILDERILVLNRQGKVPIGISCQGHEAAQMGSAWAALRNGPCFFFPYYRDLALKITAGVSAREALLSFMGKAGDPFSNGRQFPLQGADLRRGIIQLSNVVAAGLPQAVGYAWACRYLGEETVVLAYFGDGASSEGECHEAMNFAGIHRVPIVFFCENNRYAISVPQRKQMAIENVAERAAAYGFPGVVVDGTDLFEVIEVTRRVIAHARTQGPILIEAKVERLSPHTTDDDDRRYRSREELEQARHRDPVRRLQQYLLQEGILTPEQDRAIWEGARQEVEEATRYAEASPYPEASTLLEHIYA
jgi:2-oxoisovalerate dehydrogenase E1 component alpha subunit